MGRAQNPPPQLGHTFSSKFSTQGRQKVHSKLQIIASVASGGRGVLQFSQVGRSSSIALLFVEGGPDMARAAVVPGVFLSRFEELIF